MKTLFGLSKKAFISLSCIAVALIASGIVIGVTVSHNFANKDGNNSIPSDNINKNGTDAGLPDKNGSIAAADNGVVSSSEGWTVSLNDAKKAALADAGLNEADVSFTKTEQDIDDNTRVYDIEFSTADKKYEYEVNASDGSVIEKDVRTLTIPQSSASAESSADQKYIGVDKAKEIALKDAKLSASDVKFTKSELGTDGGIKKYDIEFTVFDKKYEYEIGAVDGSIIETDIRMLSFIPNSGTAENSDTNQYIGLERAKETALSDANVSASNATFTKTQLDNDNRTPTYDIEFRTSDKKYDYEINATNGNIIEKDIENIGTQQSPTPSNNTNNYIGLDKAKQIALSDANVSASNATFTKTQLDNDDRTPTYDIEFRTSDRKYDYEINATNGNIIEKDIENIGTQQSPTPSNNTNNYIGLDKAKQIALSDANVSASNATFTKTQLDNDDRTPTYDIEFRTSDKKYDYEINATSGNIIEKDIENIRTQQNPAPSNNTNNYIGLDKAKGIALSHAGLSESDVRFTKSELDRDDGRYEYEIEFVSGRIEYEYTIDAVSGKVLEHDSDYDD